MIFDRIAAKRRGRELLRASRPRPLLVTLVFLLLTTGLGWGVSRFVTNPFLEVLTYIARGHDVFDVYAYVFGGGRAMTAIFLSIFLSLLNIVFSFGYTGYTLRLSRGEETGYGALLLGFGQVGRVVLLNLYTTLLISLWSMLFYIPGVIAAYRYSQANRCLLDDPEVGVLEAVRRSKSLMAGKKLELFSLHISFFGWKLLFLLLSNGVGTAASPLVGEMGAGILTTAITMGTELWLKPYMGVVTAMFYDHLVGRWTTWEERPGPRLEF